MSAVEAWPTWTPTMKSVRGIQGSVLAVGHEYEIESAQRGFPKNIFVVDDVRDGYSFLWKATSPAVTTLANHVLTEISSDLTRVELSFEMTGPLARVMWLLFGRTVNRMVQEEAASLKATVEAS